MPVKSFVLIGDEQNPLDVDFDLTQDFEALKISVASVFPIADPSGRYLGAH